MREKGASRKTRMARRRKRMQGGGGEREEEQEDKEEEEGGRLRGMLLELRSVASTA